MDHQPPGDTLRDVGTVVALDKGQCKVYTSRDTRRGPVLSAFAVNPVVVDPEVREVTLQSFGGSPVGGDLPAIQQTGGGEQEGPRANAAGSTCGLVPFPQPVDQLKIGARRINTATARYHQRIDWQCGSSIQAVVYVNLQRTISGGYCVLQCHGDQAICRNTHLFVGCGKCLPGSGEVDGLEAVEHQEGHQLWRTFTRFWHCPRSTWLYLW